MAESQIKKKSASIIVNCGQDTASTLFWTYHSLESTIVSLISLPPVLPWQHHSHTHTDSQTLKRALLISSRGRGSPIKLHLKPKKLSCNYLCANKLECVCAHTCVPLSVCRRVCLRQWHTNGNTKLYKQKMCLQIYLHSHTHSLTHRKRESDREIYRNQVMLSRTSACVGCQSPRS